MDAVSGGAPPLARLWFGKAALGDRRRTERLVMTAECLLNHPGGSLPQKLANPAALDGFYRLMDMPSVTHASVLGPAAAYTWQRMAEHDGVVLIPHDTTELDYTTLKSIEDLGQIGKGHGRGLLAHNSLAVTADRQVLGLAGQLLHARRRAPKGETKKQSAAAPDRESLLWKRGVAALPTAPAGKLWVDIGDRGADITEFLAFEHQAGRSHVTRCQHNRRVELPGADGTPVRAKLMDHMRALTPVSMLRRTLRVPARKRQPAREAQVAVAWSSMRIIPPVQRRGDHDATPLPVCVVRVWEPDPPAEVEPIQWLLLTNVPVLNEQEAWQRVDWYSVRWVIEEYHKCLKTAMGIEQMQFTSRSRLEPAIALLSVAATTLLQLRDAARRPDRRDEPAATWVPALWVGVLSIWRHGKPRPDWSVHEFLYALARLGGHQNRKGDGPPGWIVLWRGWTKLQSMLIGARASEALRCGET